MNKYRTLKAVGFFVVLAVIVAFLALPDSQAAKGKPVRWKATVAGVNLIGSVDFVGGVDHVNINNGPVTCADTSGGSYLELQAFTPSLQFKNMGGFLSWGNADLATDYIDLAPYGFPNGFPITTTIWPGCVADFLNNNLHPTAEYPHIIWRFTTCGCGNPITDLMAMGEGEILPVHMKLLFFSHIWGCPANSPFTQETFLNLHMNAHGYLKADATLPDVYIKRVGNVWTAYVDTVFDNPNPVYHTSLDNYTSADWPVTIGDNILGQYATCSSITNKKGKTTWTTTYHYPWAKAPLNFQVAFTKY
jgi:hypothetical protein